MSRFEKEILYVEDEDALVTAAYEGSIRNVKYLLKIGKNINAQDENGDTALMGAINEEGFYIALYLIKKGADVNICNNDGDYALDLARYAQKKLRRLYKNSDNKYLDDLVGKLESLRANHKNGISSKEEHDNLLAEHQKPLILDLLFKDDRKFVLEISRVETRISNKPPKKRWAVITRKNIAGYPPFRTDQFDTREDALDYYKKVVVSTPRQSFDNKPPSSVPSLEEHQNWLVKNNLYDPILNPKINGDA